MKITCLANDKNEISLSVRDLYPYSWDNLPLIIGKEYLVYGIAELRGYVWYCICDENYSYFPRYRQFPLFEISDPRISRFWMFNLQKDDFGNVGPCISFSEWVKEEYFYSNLVDGKERELFIFNRYKDLMDLEFPDSMITKSAEIGDDNWLICPSCIDGWESRNNLDALVKCPKCQKIFNNPRYTEWTDLNIL